jgi:hypothetical protein
VDTNLERVVRMWQQQVKRTKATVKRELVDATGRRQHAIGTQDFDAYDALTRQIDDLLDELRTWALAHP